MTIEELMTEVQWIRNDRETAAKALAQYLELLLEWNQKMNLTAIKEPAEVVEKHFIIDRSIGGPDSAFSMNVDEFAQMVKNVRQVEKSLGSVCYPTDISKIKGREFSRSLYVSEDVKSGDVVTEKNVRSVRPGFGLHPKFLHELIGRKFNRDMHVGDRMSWDVVE